MSQTQNLPQTPSAKPTKPVKHFYRIGNSYWSLAIYGIVNFLKGKPYFRGLVSVFAAGLGIFGILSLMGLYQPVKGFSYSYYVVFFIVPWLFYVAVISGDEFSVEPGEWPQAAQVVTEKAKNNFDTKKSVESALEADLSQLNSYYSINQSQAKTSFTVAVIAMAVGLATIIFGVWLSYGQKTQSQQFVAALSTASGVIVNAIAGLFLYLYNKTQERSLVYYNQLSQVQRIFMAIRIVENQYDEQEKAEARKVVIRYLLGQATATQSIASLSETHLASGDVSVARSRRPRLSRKRPSGALPAPIAPASVSASQRN